MPEIENEHDGISLKVPEKKPSLIRKEGILVHHGSDSTIIDTADFINLERQHRNNDIAQHIAAETPER